MVAGMTRAAALLREALIWDNHVCLPHRQEMEWFDRLEAHRSRGVSFASVNIGDAQVPLNVQFGMAEHFRDCVAARPDRFCMAETIADVHHARQTGRLAIAFDVEGAWAMHGDLSHIAGYARLGVKWLLIAFNRANAAGGGVHDEEDVGLTPFGVNLLDALDAHGIVACCSHTGYRTARMAIDHQAKTGRTMIFSHSNARALDDHPRNIPDTLIDAIARIDGVVGLNGLSVFLGSAPDLVSRFVDHACHVADRVGPNHVGIGLDYVYDQVDMDRQLSAARGTWPPGYGYEPGIRYLAPAALEDVVDRLLARRWRDEDVYAFLGNNFLRVAERVWQ